MSKSFQPEQRSQSANHQSSTAPIQREANPQSMMDNMAGTEPHYGFNNIPILPPDGGASSLPRANRTGLPNQLKDGLEGLSGISMDSVRVTYNSSKPSKVGALAYTQGSQIYIGPGQEKHLPHEGWHAVQQQQGRVTSSLQMKGQGLNNDAGLEREADIMGAKAAGWSGGLVTNLQPDQSLSSGPIQREVPEGLGMNFPVLVIATGEEGIITAWHANDHNYTVMIPNRNNALGSFAPTELNPTVQGQRILDEQLQAMNQVSDNKSKSSKNQDQQSSALSRFVKADNQNEQLQSPYYKKSRNMDKFVAKTKHGEWTFYSEQADEKDNYGIHVHIDFKINNQGDDRQIILLQAVKRMRKGGNDVHIRKFNNPADYVMDMGGGKVADLNEDKMMPHGTHNGFHTFIDQYAKDKSPVYSSKNDKNNTLYGSTTDKYASTGKNQASLWDKPMIEIDPSYPNYQGKEKKIEKSKHDLLKRASSLKIIDDDQADWGDTGQTLETTAILINKNGDFQYLGSIIWGWKLNNKKQWTSLDPEVVSEDNPSELFLSAARAWNKDDTRTPIPLPKELQ